MTDEKDASVMRLLSACIPPSYLSMPLFSCASDEDGKSFS